MSLSGINSAGEAYIYISSDNDGLNSGLKSAKKAIDNFADSTKDVDISLFSKIASETAFAGLKSLLTSTTEAFMGYGDQFEKMSQRTGMGTEALTKYAYVAEMCGTNIETLEGAIRASQKLMGESANGSAEAANKLKLLGLSYNDLKNLSPEEQFQTMLKAVAKIPDPTNRAAMAMKLFEDAGSQLMPMLNAGADGIDAYVQEAIASGKVLSQESSNQSAALSDATGRMKASFEGLGNTIAANFVPIATKAFRLFGDGLNLLTSYAQACPGLTKSVTLLTGAFAGLGVIGYSFARLKDYGKVFVENSKSIIVLVKNIFSVQTATKIWTACNVALSASLKGIQIAIAAISAHPIIAVATALAAVAAGYLVWSKMSKKHVGEAAADLDSLKSKLDELNNDASGKFKFLEVLAQKQRLTNQELVDATRILKELKARYGDVGISIDQMTGRVVMASDAQGKLNEALRNQAVAQTRLAIEEKLKEVDAKQKKYDEAQNRANTHSELTGYGMSVTPRVRTDEEIKKLSEKAGQHKMELDKSLADLDVLRAQLEAFENGGTVGNPDAKEEGWTPSLKDVGEYEKYLDEFRRSNLAELDRKIEDENRAAQKILDIEKDRFDKGLSSEQEYNDRVIEINRIAEEKIRKLNEESNKKIAEEQAKVAKESQNKYNEAVKAVKESTQRLNQYEQSELDRKIETIRKETEEHKKKLNDLLNLERKKPESEQNRTLISDLQNQIGQTDVLGKNRISKEIDDATEKNRWQETDQKIAEKETALSQAVMDGDQDKVASIQGEIDNLNYQKSSEQLQKAMEERDAAMNQLKEAQESGDQQLIANAWEKVNGKESSFQTALNEMKNLTGKDVTPSKFVADKIESGLAQTEKVSSRGTFSAFEASQLGGTTYEKKLADNSEKSTDYLRRINDKVDQQTARFAS